MLVAGGWLLAALVISLLLVHFMIGYAYRRGLLDLPGRRRSHQQPTPRGGGIGIVMVMLLCAPWVLSGTVSHGVVASWIAGLLLIAGIGWWDDHRPLQILPRLAVQVLAVSGFSAVLVHGGGSWWWLLLLMPAGVWSVNLHNFMDGIDGLLALQSMFVACGLALLAWSIGQPALALAAAMLMLAAFGFSIYNRPPARIFMGDVGSGSIGWIIFAFSAMLWRIDQVLIWPCLILSSAFAVDAGLTLLSRMLRGRRWYAAHREHLYQWLVRRGAAHAQVAWGYLAWNLLVVAPLAWLALIHPTAAIPLTMVAYVAAGVTWFVLKSRLVHRRLPKVPHAAA